MIFVLLQKKSATNMLDKDIFVEQRTLSLVWWSKIFCTEWFWWKMSLWIIFNDRDESIFSHISIKMCVNTSQEVTCDTVKLT